LSEGIFWVIGVCAAILFVGFYIIYPLTDSQEGVIVTVHEKWVKSQGKGMIYLFSDSFGNVYSIEDSWIKQEFDASDRYAKIQPGKTYRIDTFGKRLHIPTNYPNAIHIEEVKSSS